MAQTTTTYPKIPATAWRILRSRAASAPSTKFTASTVAAVLQMASPRSAMDNIVAPLRKVGLVDDDGSLTTRGNKWRIDTTYAEACQEIIDAVYPSDLAALTDDSGRPDKDQINTWMQHQGFGGSNARQMAATYVMLAEKKVPEAPAGDSPKSQTKTRAPKEPKTRSGKAAVSTEHKDEGRSIPADPMGNKTSSGPSVHLDIQIHIPADASAEQIDKIFASMAKHLYSRE